MLVIISLCLFVFFSFWPHDSHTQQEKKKEKKNISPFTNPPPHCFFFASSRTRVCHYVYSRAQEDAVFFYVSLSLKEWRVCVCVCGDQFVPMRRKIPRLKVLISFCANRPHVFFFTFYFFIDPILALLVLTLSIYLLVCM